MGIAYGPVAKRMWNLGAGSHPYTVAIFCVLSFHVLDFCMEVLTENCSLGWDFGPGERTELGFKSEARCRRPSRPDCKARQTVAAVWTFGQSGYGSIPIKTIFRGWTSIYQLFWCSPGVQGFDPLPSISSQPGYPKRAIELSRHVARMESSQCRDTTWYIYDTYIYRGYKPTFRLLWSDVIVIIITWSFCYQNYSYGK